MRNPFRGAATVVALALAACGSFDVAGPDRPSPPLGLSAGLVQTAPPLVQLEWTAPAGSPPDIIQIELRIAGGPWRPFNAFPGGATGGVVSLPWDTPDGVDVALRIVAVDNGIRSDPTAEVTVPLPVLPALNPYLSASGGSIYVSWQRQSVGADAVRVERRLEPVAGDPGPWATVLLGGTDLTSYDDGDLAAWRDGAVYAYRVVYLAGARESAPLEVRSGGGKPLTPIASAETVSGSVHISWTYPGAAPVRIRITKTGLGVFGTELAWVDPPATSYDDVGPAPALWTYGVQAILPGNPWWDALTSSDPVEVPALVPDPALAGVLDARMVEMPAATLAARGPGGGFALVRAFPEPLTTFAEEGGAWVSWAAPSGTRASFPGVAVDGAAAPHFFYEVATGTWNAWWRLEHRVRTGGAWSVDVGGVISAPGVDPSSSALDAAGDPHFEWQDYGGGSLPISWAVRRDGTWSSENLPPPWDGLMRTGPLATDPAGEPGLLAGSGPVQLLRHAAGTWSADPLPDSATWVSSFVSRLHLPAADRAIVAGYAFGPLGEEQFWVLERDSVGWKAAERVPLSGAGPFGQVYSAVSPDGARVALATSGQVAVRTGGAWTTLPLVAVPGGATLGFTPAGKLWVLQGLGTASAAERAAYVLYDEP